MSESFQLAEWEEARCGFENKPVYNPPRKKPLCFVIFVGFVIMGATIGANLFYTHMAHSSNSNLKSTLLQHEQIIKLHQIISKLEQEYAEAIKNNISADGMNKDTLLELHNSTKASTIDNFDADTNMEIDAQVLQIYKDQLARKLDKLFDTTQESNKDSLFKKESRRENDDLSKKIENFIDLVSKKNMETQDKNTKIIEERELSIRMEIGALINDSIKAESGKCLVRLLAHKYFQSLETKMYSMESVSELENFYEPERQRILKEFEVNNVFSQNSSLYNILKEELEKDLDKVYQGLETLNQDWNLTMAKAFQQVQEVYSEVSKRAILEYKGNDLLSPEISWEFHDKMTQIAISKCVRQNLVPISAKIVLQSKNLLDEAYHKKICDNAVIGIDFGYNQASAAVYFRGKIQRIPHLDRSGEIYNSTACYVGVSQYDGYVGQCAEMVLESSLQLSPIIYNMKQIIFSWSGSTLKNENKIRTFDSHDGGTEGPFVSGVGFRYSIQFIVSKLFSKIRENAEAFVGQPVKRCVITYPSVYFGSDKNSVISNAAKTAGFRQVTQYEEHSSAPLAAQHVNGVWNTTKQVLYLDFAAKLWVFTAVQGLKASFNYRSYNRYDGGFYLKESLVKYSVKKFSETEKVAENVLLSDSFDGRIQTQRLLESCGKAIKRLETMDQTTIFVDEFFSGKTLSINVTRQHFEALNSAHFNQIGLLLNSLLSSIGQRKENVEVIIVGENSRIPKVRQVLASYFPGKHLHIPGIEVEDVVAYGAAVKGAMLAADAIKANKSI